MDPVLIVPLVAPIPLCPAKQVGGPHHAIAKDRQIYDSIYFELRTTFQ